MKKRLAGNLLSPSGVEIAADDDAADPTDAWEQLTDAEWRLTLFASSGWNDRRIARATGKTQAQVKGEFQALLDKLGLADRLTLILASFAEGARLQSHICGERMRDLNNEGQVYAERNG